ncbi:tetratricopeptide repeat protein [Pendulispora rubella]|uniref:Tetratricopeptide repeat protein n=1 Tax=Pendulispora rubella TaxID=2741070 RepID=A0ABZ2LFV7_9BACT
MPPNTKDTPHSAEDLARALAVRPNDSETLALADAWIAAAKDPLELVPLHTETTFAMVALRARVLATRGKVTEAIELLLQVVATRPDVSYLPWATAWARQSGEQVDPTSAAGAVVTAMARLDEYARVLLPFFVELVEALRAHHPRSPALAATLVRLLRQSGDERALVVAREAYAQMRTPELAVIVATTLRAHGEHDEAIAMFEEALQLDPKLVPAWLDIGDILLDTGRFEDAANAYERALVLDPDSTWAKASLLCAKLEITGDRAYLHELHDLAESHPDDARAQSLLDAATPWVGYLPTPEESSIHAIVGLLEHIESGKPVPPSPRWTFHVSALEAPSVRLVAAQFLSVVRPDARIVFDVEQVPKPDPRVPFAPVDWLVWRYEGTEPHPNLPPPDREKMAGVVNLASQPFSAAAWLRSARAAAKGFRPEEAPLLLAQMVHPPLSEQQLPPWRWIPRLQLACAYVLAAIDEGWNGSWRKRALLSLVHGPMDWTAMTGIVALTEIARAEPEHREEIRAILWEILKTRKPSAGYWCLHAPLATCLRRIPGETTEGRSRLRELSLSL